MTFCNAWLQQAALKFDIADSYLFALLIEVMTGDSLRSMEATMYFVCVFIASSLVELGITALLHVRSESHLVVECILSKA